MKKCKICNNDLTKQRQDTYCSNACKYSDKELNAKRAKKEKNDKTKQLKCNLCGKIIKDILNLGGHAEKHLNVVHPTIQFNNYIELYTIEDIIEKPKWVCPICNKWSTVDLTNKSGFITIHLRDIHNYSIDKFCTLYPDNKGIWNHYFRKQKEIEILNSNENNYLTCMECNKRMKKISNTHLISKHNITPEQYKLKYNINNTSSKNTIYKQTKSSNNIEIKSKMISKLLETNNKRFGANSYSQTVKGKERIRLKTLKNTYDKYMQSKILNTHVELKFSLQEYIGNKGEYSFLCKKCNQEFISKIENGRIPRCFNCYPKINKGYSNSEKEVVSFLKNELKINNIIENGKIKNINLDIICENEKITIEYNGLHWHSEISGNKDRNYHLNKTIQCEDNEYKLIHIFEDEWIYKQDIVKNRLKVMFNKIENKIYARNCQCVSISQSEKETFLDLFHLQGGDSSLYKFGLKYKGELIAVMTFSKYKYKKSSDDIYELSRFAIKSDCILVGGFSKLLKYFIKNYGAKKIITFADRRWSNKENVYLKNGFNLIGATNPSYWYFNDSYNRQHRFKFRKNQLKTKLKNYDASLSEWENMQLNGYDRIWDCGHLKYELAI